ncbi:MAG: hypothetical protein LBQ91_01220 [Oscillospiraceae bacterium]|jgi:predicted RNA-binding Zn-ribbon protein involved in translation (DUF1610 family)|nr:hypothetical protein [Oscillospiraceae bacterium]
MRLIKKWLDKVTYRNVTRVTAPPMFLGIFLTPFGVLPHLMWVSLLGLVIVIAAVVLNVAKWRCPHCGVWLGRIWGIPKYCNSCGKELDKK